MNEWKSILNESKKIPKPFLLAEKISILGLESGQQIKQQKKLKQLSLFLKIEFMPLTKKRAGEDRRMIWNEEDLKFAKKHSNFGITERFQNVFLSVSQKKSKQQNDEIETNCIRIMRFM